MDFVSILERFGFPLALCAVLLYAIYKQNTIVQSQNKALVDAHTNRIDILEALCRKLQSKVDALEADRINRADEYARTLKDVADRYAGAIREQSSLTRQTIVVMTKLVDSINIRPCMATDYQPHRHPTPLPPSSDELPTPPAQRETDVIPASPARPHA